MLVLTLSSCIFLFHLFGVHTLTFAEKNTHTVSTHAKWVDTSYTQSNGKKIAGKCKLVFVIYQVQADGSIEGEARCNLNQATLNSLSKYSGQELSTISSAIIMEKVSGKLSKDSKCPSLKAILPSKKVNFLSGEIALGEQIFTIDFSRSGKELKNNFCLWASSMSDIRKGWVHTGSGRNIRRLNELLRDE